MKDNISFVFSVFIILVLTIWFGYKCYKVSEESELKANHQDSLTELKLKLEIQVLKKQLKK